MVDYLTTEQLAQRYGMSEQQVSKHASEDSWPKRVKKDNITGWIYPVQNIRAWEAKNPELVSRMRSQGRARQRKLYDRQTRMFLKQAAKQVMQSIETSLENELESGTSSQGSLIRDELKEFERLNQMAGTAEETETIVKED